MNDQRLSQALGEWQGVLSADQIRTDAKLLEAYGESTSFEKLLPSAILYPVSTEQVSQVAKIAHRNRVPLHAFSRGRNWGYGDRCAPTSGQVILDLSRMNRIIEVNTRLAYAVIEPGVSQGQMAKHLSESRSGLWMDCTGAGPEASLVGNAVDRGFGHTRYGDHTQTACGYEIVLADGRVLRTGFGHFSQAKSRYVYKYGIGPILDGLFSQSGLGIITQIGIWLMPEPEAFCAYFFQGMRDEQLEEIVDQLAPYKLDGTLQSAVHVANDLRALSGRMGYPWERAQGKTPLPDALRKELARENGLGAWNGCGAITGRGPVVKATQAELKRVLAPYRPIFLDDRKLKIGESVLRFLRLKKLSAKLEIAKPVYEMLKGGPVDEPLTGATWRLRDRSTRSAHELKDPLACGAGLVWLSPILPMEGVHARAVMRILEPIFSKYGFETLITFTLLTERSLAGVSNIFFDRREADEANRARRCYEEAFSTLMKEGYIPYRTGPSGFAKLGQGSQVYWDVVSEIKTALDPMGILSPGRYDPVALAELSEQKPRED